MALSVENQLFMFLMKLRQNTDNIELDFSFGVSDRTVSEIFDTYLRFLYHTFKDLDSLVVPKGCREPSHASRIQEGIV